MASYSGGPGFKSAGAYYATLKRQFLKNCEENYEREQNKQLEASIKVFENKQYNRFKEFQKAKGDQKLLNELIKTGDLVNAAFAGDPSIRAQVDSLIQQYEQSHGVATEEIRSQYRELALRIRAMLFTNDEVVNSVRQIVNSSSGGVTLSAVENEYLSYISRQITKQMTAITQIFDLNQAAIAGYYQEATESKAMSKLMSEVGAQAAHAGTLISSRTKTETPMDIIIGKPSSGKTLESQALNDYDNMLKLFDNLNISVEATEQLPDFWSSILKDAKIKTAGIQSKLYTINFTKPRPKGYGIGSRAELKDNFYAWAKRRAITQALTAEYFNESYTAIIEAFGPTTLLFRTGSQRFFMDELIQALEEHNFMIAFNLTAANKLSNYVSMMPFVDDTIYITDNDST